MCDKLMQLLCFHKYEYTDKVVDYGGNVYGVRKYIVCKRCGKRKRVV